MTLVLVGAGLLIGLVSSPYDMCNHMLIGWAIDEDAARHPDEPRREGMFWACNAMVQHLSQVLIGLTIAWWGASGYDTRLCPEQQPLSASRAIDYSFTLLLPALSLLGAAVSFAYPIQGARLRALEEIRRRDPAPPSSVVEPGGRGGDSTTPTA